MKRVVIGIACLISGLSFTSFLLLCGVLHLPHLTAWSRGYASRLFFTLFAGESPFGDGADGLGLGVFFVFGVLLALGGLVMLIREYFGKDK